jgi:hypothetical protein
MRSRSVASLVLVALIAGAIAAHADSGRAPRPTGATSPAAALPAAPAAAPVARRSAVLAVPRFVPFAADCAAPVPLDRRGRPLPQKPATAAPPSKALLDAFAILRRERRPEDALSPEVLEALRVRGLSPVSLDSARLLRSTPSGGRAWVVPVPNVVAGLGFACEPKGKTGPREGLAVVAVGDAASGGGGALDDLVRGRSPVTVAPCAGADHSMLSISGIVPNGVASAFLTAPDGTAVRADVKDNGYEFLLPSPRAYEERYVVWTGGDGTPHVQPVVTFGRWNVKSCEGPAKLARSLARVSPDGFAACTTPPVPTPGAPPVAARPLPRALGRPPLTSKFLYVARCWEAGRFAPGLAVPGRAVPVPPAVVVPGDSAPAPLVVPGRPVPPRAVPARPRKPR